MAAYAAVASLMNVIYNVQNHPQFSISLFDEKQAESLGEKLDFLLDFIESNHSHELLEREIASAAHAAEDVIESHIVDQIHSGSISSLDLQKVIKVMDHVKDKVVNFKEEKGGLSNVHQQYSMSATSSTAPITGGGKSTKMVGFEEELIQLLDGLTGQQSSLQIIPIVGMGGIGKTTLARNAYEHGLIVNHFDIRAWAIISQEYSLKEIFSKLLPRKKGSQPADEQELTQQDLSQKLYQSLIGRRYLIILDDVWSIDAWEKMMHSFPDNNNGSRIILTTRLSNVASYFGSSLYFSLKFLDEDKTWKLFSEKAFLQERCPPELEEIGKNIAKKCKGFPLLLVVIGGLLKKSLRTQEVWENIAKDINSIVTSEEDAQILDILSLSYSHLPAHLKPPFLYMGIFPEDSEIHVSEIIQLWIAEGFIKPNKTQILEEVAECYLKDIVDRNLLLVGRSKLNGKIKFCIIHDLLRDLCIKAAQKEKFLYLIRFRDCPSGINKARRRILCHEKFAEVNCDPLPSHTLESEPLTRSFLGYEGWLPLNFRLLRVLNVVRSNHDILKQVNLRYLPTNWYESELPSSISLLWNLQTLKIGGFAGLVAPPEIWVMPQLRHLEFFESIFLPDPPLRSEEKDNVIVLKNLQTIKGVLNLKLTDEVCKRIPNVKKLKIEYIDLSKSSCYNHLYNIGKLHKLESLSVKFCSYFSVFRVLKYIVCSPPRSLGNFLKNLQFPTSLKKLTLSDSNLEWEDLTWIGSLPNLEVLRLGFHSVRGSKWNPIQGQFLRLKYLRIEYSRLKYWNAESFHFPALESLVLKNLHKLVEIPFGIGEIPTLGLIRLFACSESVAISATTILEEQQSQGNEDLRVRIKFWREHQLDWFKEKVDSFECFNTNNLQLSHLY
ncbi:hypothetical protein ABFS83_04G169100 [Erythranthe nasuta]